MAPSVPDVCPELWQVLGAYLHQDFDLDYASAENGLLAGIAEASVERLVAAARELRTHRPSQHDEESTRSFVNQLCDYRPPGDGLTYVTWLDHVQELLDRSQRP